MKTISKFAFLLILTSQAQSQSLTGAATNLANNITPKVTLDSVVPTDTNLGHPANQIKTPVDTTTNELGDALGQTTSLIIDTQNTAAGLIKGALHVKRPLDVINPALQHLDSQIDKIAERLPRFGRLVHLSKTNILPKEQAEAITELRGETCFILPGESGNKIDFGAQNLHETHQKTFHLNILVDKNRPYTVQLFSTQDSDFTSRPVTGWGTGKLEGVHVPVYWRPSSPVSVKQTLHAFIDCKEEDAA